MAGSFATVARRLTAAGYDPAIARDIEHTLNRLAGRLGRSLLMASPHGVVSWIVAGVDPEAMTATLVCGEQSLTAGPDELCALFGVAGVDRVN